MTVDVRLNARRCSSTADSTTFSRMSPRTLRRHVSTGDQKASDCVADRPIDEFSAYNVNEQKENLVRLKVNADEEEASPKSSCVNTDERLSPCASTVDQTDNDEQDEQEEDTGLVEDNRALVIRDRELTTIGFCSSV